jgi:hypothetical protein
MERLQEFAPALALAGTVLGLAAVVASAAIYMRLRGFLRPYAALLEATEKEGATAALQAQVLGIERNVARIEATHAYAQHIETQLQRALQGVGFLKYDAFEDIRGQQSYSLCLLDAHQDGVIITSIAGRNDYRGYAKPVKHGHCDLAMSDEEKQVLALAKQSLPSEPVRETAVTPAAAPAEAVAAV